MFWCLTMFKKEEKEFRFDSNKYICLIWQFFKKKNKKKKYLF